MPPLFPSRANRVFRGILLALVALAAAVPLGLMGWTRSPHALGLADRPEQPVPFDHRHHVRDDGIDCRYCHWTVDRAPEAGIPASDLCMNCHAQVLNDSPLLEPVRRSVEEGRPIPWVRVHRLPDFVFFDHRAHVQGGVGCETCHGRVDLMARVYQTAPLTMGWCLECHRDPLPHLRPPSEVTTMGYGPRDSTRVARRLDEPLEGSREARPPPGALPDTVRLSPGTDCSTCHR